MFRQRHNILDELFEHGFKSSQHVLIILMYFIGLVVFTAITTISGWFVLTTLTNSIYSIYETLKVTYAILTY